MRHPSSTALDLEDQAATFRRYAASVRKTGAPIDVPWPHGPSGLKSLHQLTSLDLEAEADLLDRDAAKLRSLYSSPK